MCRPSPLQTWTHEFTLSPPQHFCTHTYRLNHTQVTLLPASFPSIPQWAREVRKKSIDEAATLFLPFLHPSPPPLPPPQPSSPHSTLSNTDHTVQPTLTSVWYTCRHYRPTGQRLLHTADLPGPPHRLRTPRRTLEGGGKRGLSDAHTETKVLLGKGSP